VSQPGSMYKRWITTTATRRILLYLSFPQEGMDGTQRIIIQGKQRQCTFVQGQNGRKQNDITQELCLL
jgi:hypothetical protein